MSGQLGRRAGLAPLAALLVMGVVLAALGAPAEASSTPALERTIGGSLRAEMYPSGLEVGPDDTIVIADTANNQVAKYAPDGTQLWRVGSYGSGVGNFDNPRDIGIDDAGNVYVVDTRNSRVVKLSPSGAWIAAWTGGEGPDSISWPMGATVTGNRLYLGDTGRQAVRVMDTTTGATVRMVRATPGTLCHQFQGIRDAEADSAGNIYVAGYQTNHIFKLTAQGECITRWGSTGSGPGQFRTPYAVRTAVDPVWGEVLYVSDALNNRVQVFTLDGQLLALFGSFGEPEQVGTFTTHRRLGVTSSGDVWSADLWGSRIVRHARTPGGATPYTYGQTIGALVPEPTDTAVFHEPRQVAFAADGTLLIADTVHHQFTKMSPSGQLLGTCGQRAAEGAALGQFNWPRGIAVDPVTGDVWLADTKQNRIQIIRQDCSGVAWIGESFPGSSLTAFNWPYAIAMRASDRTAWVVDTQNHRVKSYDVATRQPIATWGSRGTGWAQMLNPGGIAVHPTTGRIYVSDTNNHRILELADTGGGQITRVRMLNAGGTLDGPEGLTVDAEGRIYIADSRNDRVVILGADGSTLATIPGLNHPASVSLDAQGRIYVSDTYNDIIKVYASYSAPPPDTTAPTATVTTPTAGQTFTPGTITLTGTATDNVGVTSVQVGIQNTTTKLWLRPNGTWGTFAWLPATLANPGATSTTWTLPFTPPATGGYGINVRTDDAAGNTNDPRPWVAFTVG